MTDSLSSGGSTEEGTDAQRESAPRSRRGLPVRLGMRAGFYPGAPRRNALVAIGYLIVAAALARLLGLF